MKVILDIRTEMWHNSDRDKAERIIFYFIPDLILHLDLCNIYTVLGKTILFRPVTLFLSHPPNKVECAGKIFAETLLYELYITFIASGSHAFVDLRGISVTYIDSDILFFIMIHNLGLVQGSIQLRISAS